MAHTASISSRGVGPTEMTNDPRFRRRIERLVLISAAALGVITLLVVWAANTGWVATGLMLAGWVTMPTLLAASLSRPHLRYLLAVPATIVSASLLVVAIGLDGSAWARAGWWSMAAGVLAGGALGAWFWYRWVPVPRPFDEPFSRGRWALIAVHAGLVIAGGAVVALAEVF